MNIAIKYKNIPMQQRLLLVIIILLLQSYKSTAQNSYSRFEISGSIGLVSGVQVIEALSQTSRSDEYLNGATPNYFASVRYYTSPLFSIGLTTGFQQLWGSSNGDYYGNKVQYRYNDYFYTLVPEAIFLYTHRKKVQTYFLFGLGISYNDREYDLYDGGNLPDNHLVSGFGPRTQITPFGIKVGDILSGVFEVGFGYKGIINAGLSYKFQSKHAKE